MGSKKNAVLALDEPRAVRLKAKDHEFVYHLSRITCDDWLEYFQGIVNQVVQHGREREQVVDSDGALLALVNKVLVTVEGYGDLEARANWRNELPLRHRIAVGWALRSVGAAKEQEDEPTLCDRVEVKLNCTWPNEKKTLFYEGLIHRFRHPSLDDMKKFQMELARVTVRGTATEGVTIYPSRQAIAMKLYDELIESVEGYTVKGAPLSGVEAIRREMDGAHKAAAALELFEDGEEVAIA